MENLEKIKSVLVIVGSIALGLPALLHALVLFFKAIPGENPDKILEKILAGSEAVAAVVTKVFPKA